MTTRNSPAAHRFVASPARGALTLNDVALALGVSRTTVSNAFNRPEQLSTSLRETILGKARELGYLGPHPMARALRRRELREVGVVLHHDCGYAFTDPVSMAFLRGVSSELDPRGLTLQLIPKVGRKLMLDAAFRATADVLIVHAEIGAEFYPMLRRATKPVVLVDTRAPGIASVCSDDRAAAAVAMRHVLDRRPDRVIVVCFLVTDAERLNVLSRQRVPRSGYVGTERMAGYVLAAREAGFPLDRLLWLDVDDQWPESAAERIATLRSELPAGARIGMVAMSDRMALAARATAGSWRGVDLVSVVGFDDIPAAEPAGLTTLRQDMFAKGQLAVRMALDGAPARRMPLELVVRDT